MGNQAHRPALILVKHGQPAIVPEVPRSQWALSDEGRTLASRLAEKLARFEPAQLFASPESKAHDTAAAMGEVLGLAVRTDPDLAEHRADHNPFVSPAEIEALIERALRDPDHLVMGEETGAAARARFAAAMERVAAAGHGTKVVVAHGRIISLWLSAQLAFDPVPFWRRLGFTSAAVVAQDGFEIIDA
ncbi:MAG: histidine phosphatase family protein [Phenylobacterium sp.]|nr:histidine phosphatase family protein [Phenylobacterium sp.]